MAMDPATIKSVAGVLAAWNPLGPKVADVPDLDGYSTEAIDIISVIGMGPVTLKAVESAVQRVMNEAFNLSLAPQHCRDAAEKIHVVLASQEQ